MSFSTITSLWRYEKLRFLLVGGFNMTLSFLLFTALYWALHPYWHYLVILTLNFALSVSLSFTTFKLLVFRSKAHPVPEYLRFFGVNILGYAVNLLLLHTLVANLHMNVVFSQFLATLWVAAQSYYGHKYFSFNVGLLQGNKK